MLMLALLWLCLPQILLLQINGSFLQRSLKQWQMLVHCVLILCRILSGPWYLTIFRFGQFCVLQARQRDHGLMPLLRVGSILHHLLCSVIAWMIAVSMCAGGKDFAWSVILQTLQYVFNGILWM